MRDAAALYASSVSDILKLALTEERSVVRQAGTLVSESFLRDGLLYVFGSGHSHMFAEESFFRAGGSIRIAPILVPRHMLHISAEHSTELERETGHADKLLSEYNIDPTKDVLLVVSNSGTNALPVEVAVLARSWGIPVIGITSIAYACSKPRAATRLHEVVDIIVDNHCPPGDATVELAEGLPRIGPVSSVVGMALLNSILVDALEKERTGGREPEILLSAGMPGALERNKSLIEQFRTRIRHI